MLPAVIDKAENSPGVEVLVVGAGPTGLALAVELARYGIRFRIIDQALDRAHESRALAIQSRTLEVLTASGVAADLVEAGNRAVQVRMHVRHRVIPLLLFNIGVSDTAFPYLLFLSQAETERLLAAHLALRAVAVERGLELLALRLGGDGTVATIRHDDGHIETVHASYVVGCDGAHSTVRQLAGIEFEGSAYPQAFVLADLEAEGLEAGAVHTFLSDHSLLFFFPLGRPATWRLIAMRAPADAPSGEGEVTLADVQALVDAHSDLPIRLHDPVWMTNFHLQNRGATQYRSGRAFLAGDAAHIHSPAGAQGMNTGIQDAANLGWKLALAVRGDAPAAILDTYEAERAPVGRAVRHFTDRAFLAVTSSSPVTRVFRTRVMPRILPLALSFRAGRRFAFRSLSELGITYRGSVLASAGAGSRRAPRPGDRLPDMPLTRQQGTARTRIHALAPTSLHALVAAPGWHLLLCGRGWTAYADEDVTAGFGQLVRVHRLSQKQTLGRLGVGARGTALLLVRPDGRVAYRSGGVDLTGLHAYLDQWMVTAASRESSRPAGVVPFPNVW
ncbi:FAD-dependent monooxygenase [Cryobacterium sp. MLB-32]|uniref:FAD-dependent monooxygenase n=1 Tax=Cryobacterium sp. MLB-32 TaxID=1529318 RepID=UPI0009E08B40|nr:FAD-dependent monooxygenase [Cryobacterium sp. MLB-32]